MAKNRHLHICVTYMMMLLFFLTVDTFASLERVTTSPNKSKKKNARVQITPNQPSNVLWQAFLGPNQVPSGVSNLSVSLVNGHFAGALSGTYKNIDEISGVTMIDGIVMTTGFAKDAVGPNDRTNTSGEHGWPGDGDLQAAAGATIFDAAVLEIKFTCDNTVEGFAFDFSFGSEEFPEFVGKFNDVFIGLHNGFNFCKDNNGNLISVNNAFFKVDNAAGEVDLEYDGFTYVLKASRKLSPGSHTIKLAVGDAKDQRLDSGVFLSNFRFNFEGNIIIPQIDIVKDETFTIPKTSTAGDIAGKITNHSPYGPVSIKEFGNTPEFQLKGWDIEVANGVDFSANPGPFKMKVIATLDTTWGGKPWVVHDTATMTIRVEETDNWPDLTEAFIYDDNGDGLGDKITAKFKYKFPDKYSPKEGLFEWPAGDDYAEKLSNADLSTDRRSIEFTYTPKANAKIWTKGKSELGISIDSSGQTSIHKHDLEDKIGPVIMEASVVKRYKPDPDTFTVELSEPVDVKDIKGKSFVLIKKNHAKEIELEPLNNNVTDLSGEERIRFLIKDLGADAPKEGDSLQILSSGPVIDKKKNKAHKDNRIVPIKFTNGNLDPWPEIDLAQILDKDGDGIGDSVHIKFKGSFIDSMDADKAKFKWPDGDIDYSVNLKKSNEYPSDRAIAFSFPPDGSADVWTKGTSKITLELDSLGKEVVRKDDLEDGIGPLLKSVLVVPRPTPAGVDTFYVKVTEPVNKVSDIKGESFVLIKGKSGKKINLTPAGSVKDLKDKYYLKFVIDIKNDAPEIGDSLQIYHKGPVVDVRKNKAHKDNTPQPIIYGHIPVETAYYRDVNADGTVDRVDLTFVDTLKSLKDIEFNITWAGETAKDVPASFVGSNRDQVTLDLEDPFKGKDKIKNITGGEMKMTVIYKEKDEKTEVVYDVTDKAAPVIVTAQLIDSLEPTSMDVLTLKFSENVDDIDKDEPFNFYYEKKKSDQYDVKVKTLSITNDMGLFRITDVDNKYKDKILNGDWININYKGEVQDVAKSGKNEQTNSKNVKRQIYVKEIPIVYDVVPKASLLSFTQEHNLEKLIKDPCVGDIVNDAKKGSYMLLVLAPEKEDLEKISVGDEISSDVAIYDALGNKVLDEKAMCWQQDNSRTIYLWDGKNNQNRFVGSGSYYAVFDVRYIFKGEIQSSRTTVKKVVIGVTE